MKPIAELQMSEKAVSVLRKSFKPLRNPEELLLKTTFKKDKKLWPLEAKHKEKSSSPALFSLFF